MNNKILKSAKVQIDEILASNDIQLSCPSTVDMITHVINFMEEQFTSATMYSNIMILALSDAGFDIEKISNPIIEQFLLLSNEEKQKLRTISKSFFN